jgi:hypothetical protein
MGDKLMFKVIATSKISNWKHVSKHETIEEANAWIESQENTPIKGSKFYGARSILKSECPETHLGLVLSEETRIDEMTGEELVYVNLDKEYEITIVDLSQDAEWIKAEAIRKRKAEYPAVEELWNVFCDKGPNSAEWIDLMAYRASVKNKHKFPIE